MTEHSLASHGEACERGNVRVCVWAATELAVQQNRPSLEVRPPCPLVALEEP